QRRHGALEHQRRSRIDESRVDPAQPLEHDANEEHREYRSGNAQRLNDKGQHGSARRETKRPAMVTKDAAGRWIAWRRPTAPVLCLKPLLEPVHDLAS